jgi:hypothetical protein
MELNCESDLVLVERRWWRFERRVLQARRIGDRVLVIFDYMNFPQGRPAKNLVAYDLSQQELWRAETPEGGPADAYVNFICDDPLKVWNFACYVCTIDVTTGCLVDKSFTK